jgi:RNA-directed DNA polymerase
MHKENMEETLAGTPQGGIVSPLLANIYLHELDRYMESKYLNLSSSAKLWRRQKGKANYLYVRYADDFVVLCNGTKAEAHAMKQELGELLSTMGLTLSEEKTKVTHITEGFDFLGYRIVRSIGTKGKMIPKVLVPEGAIKRFRHEARRIFAPYAHDDSATVKILAANRFIRGWCEYYRCTNSPGVIFSKLRPEVFWGMAHWLGRKYEINMPEIMRRYRRGDTLVYKSSRLVIPNEYKAKRFVARTWHNPYTAPEEVKEERDRIKRESLPTFDKIRSGGNEHRQGWGEIREEVMLLKGTVCALNLPDICESKGKPLHPSEVEIDHIIPRLKFKDLTEADRMGNLRPVCTPCHRAKTETDRKVLSRMR